MPPRRSLIILLVWEVGKSKSPLSVLICSHSSGSKIGFIN
ncbi:unnamed protein product [Nyctereutes procyonoides]|uniref:(raccoon dog) hypothetical protein n=1 Tax=Nyctereutes procyonoides TaxID=34880 RepID=A0A811Z011_NYCPR|nr:unnamed protein product [Nyctereutes procyonoides]